MSKSQLLRIQYKQDQGLIFQWNYANTSAETVYFRHVLVLFTEEKDKANSYLKKYIRKVKPGDLYYIVYINSEQELKHIGWKQKPVVEENRTSRNIIKDGLSSAYQEKALEHIEKFYQQFEEPIVVSFLLQSLEDRDPLEAKITNRRYHSKYDFIVAFFAPIEKVSLFFSNKVSTFSSLDDQIQAQTEFFLSNVYQAGIIYAKVSIECRNGAITSMIDQNWRTTSFNQVQRVYRGPSIKYDKDTLFFFNRSLQETSQDLTLKLQFMTLDRKKFQSEKRFTVISSKAFYQKTFNMDTWNKSYHAGKDIWLTENPFISFTVIKFEENTI